MATLKDIAQETGLKVETVSRILNNRGYISAASREKVQRAMEKLNYRPNEVARSLSQRKSNIIGLIVPHIEHPYFTALIRAIEAHACERGQQLFLFNSRDKEAKFHKYVDACLAYRVRGIILCSATVRADALLGVDAPIVAIECEIDNADAVILCDNFTGGRMAAEHLIERGCRHLLHLSGVQNQPMPADLRCVGFVEACESAGVAHIEISVGAQDYRILDYHALIRRLLVEHPDTDGIFLSSDLIAAQALQVCAANGFSVPGRMRIVGYDDSSIASLTVPTITTIAQPIKDMAVLAVERLMDREYKSKERRVMFPVRLVQRGTT